jgi:hypothetical protein
VSQLCSFAGEATVQCETAVGRSLVVAGLRSWDTAVPGAVTLGRGRRMTRGMRMGRWSWGSSETSLRASKMSLT